MPVKKVLVPLAPGFEEIEAITVVDVLRRADVQVETIGLVPNPVVGSHGIGVLADRMFKDPEAEAAFDMIVLPGGMPGAQHLKDHAGIQRLLALAKNRGSFTAAICAAPMALGASGLTKDKTITCYPGFEQRFEHKKHVLDRVVVDGTVVTSRGPGTALEFALTLVGLLCGARDAQKLRESMLVASESPMT